MIETNLPSAESELKEVINLFPKNDELVIKHKFTETPGKYSNLVTLAGKAYAFCNLSHDPKDEILKKRLIKRYAKLSLYRALSAYYGMTTLLKIGIILNLTILVVDIFRTVWGWRNGRREEA